MKIYDLVESPIKPVVEPFLGKKHSKKGSKKPYIYSTFFYPIFFNLFIHFLSQWNIINFTKKHIPLTPCPSVADITYFKLKQLIVSNICLAFIFFLFCIFRISQIIRYNHNYVLHIILIMWERKGIQNMIQFKFKF